jgi:hypothetical protein
MLNFCSMFFANPVRTISVRLGMAWIVVRYSFCLLPLIELLRFGMAQMMLASCSPYFYAMFTGFTERESSRVTIQQVQPPPCHFSLLYSYITYFTERIVIRKHHHTYSITYVLHYIWYLSLMKKGLKYVYVT